MVLIILADDLTLGARLERDRAEHRARRLERTLDALQARARSYAPASVPVGLRAAARDFERELTAINTRLAADRNISLEGGAQPGPLDVQLIR